MFENLTPPNNYITYALRCQWKFDFVKNLTMARSVLFGATDPDRITRAPNVCSVVDQ